MRIAVAGTGYIGLTMAMLLLQYHEGLEVNEISEKVDLINHRKSPILYETMKSPQGKEFETKGYT